MKDISTLLDELIAREGGYVNHPNDRGGPTNFGITEHVARANGYTGPMRDLPRSTAKAIYNDIYWVDPGFNQVALRHPRVAEELFDTGVNMGPTRAAMMLQRALNVLNNGVLEYPNLIVDGKLGRMSFFAYDRLVAKRGKQNSEKILLRLLDSFQAVRYVEIAEKDPSQEAFVAGWILNRVGVED